MPPRENVKYRAVAVTGREPAASTRATGPCREPAEQCSVSVMPSAQKAPIAFQYVSGKASRAGERPTPVGNVAGYRRGSSAAGGEAAPRRGPPAARGERRRVRARERRRAGDRPDRKRDEPQGPIQVTR